MCGCSTHKTEATARAHEPDAVTIRVEDMTCGHCAARITKVIEAGLPGARVNADPAARLISVRGVGDPATIRALVAQAGYTPSEPVPA